jgi:hypothetical protein
LRLGYRQGRDIGARGRSDGKDRHQPDGERYIATHNLHNLRTVALVAMSRSESSDRFGGQLIDLPLSRLSNRITYRPQRWTRCARLGACGHLVPEGS